MSKFLAPIHQWLFNKIQLMESIERAIINKEIPENMQNGFVTNLEKKIGSYLTEKPLEEQINQDNIHGWLQGRITIAETRQAYLINKIKEDNPEIIESVKKIYKDFGSKTGMEIRSQDPQDAETIFQALNNYTLEGMPCDRVNEVTNKTTDKLEWKTTRCVHEAHWTNGGTNVKVYYELREAFAKGFVETANTNFKYDFNLIDNIQYHSISKKEEK